MLLLLLALLALLFNVVEQAPALIDRLWYVLTDVIAPVVSTLASPRLAESLRAHADRVPWHGLTCHQRDERFAESLVALLPLLRRTCARVVLESLDRLGDVDLGGVSRADLVCLALTGIGAVAERLR